ncbi:Crp/Fnr family transcriptional regulator [Klebsiella pneumoniae]|jgi:AraC-like DNA-binding protein|uniref:Crp/Fnr family transcriptional regulator n=1 Tax=Enterobacteriaceae TaxID=543 RepID=UPI000E1D80DA|nr:Crp/Fnr family transcriptional regulator [Klebsiella pneumoniae]EAO5667144.1 Crp/Fnr family transcriptional regulator [Salmonella enterica]EDG0325470.1 helix-turn-helix domain-containing protein [Salmonella enterica subsp. enterica serovar Typhimurium]MIZ64813.1 Crp/Fnr family transcriptional regulator [Salmonella enterica subsp. enterica serovar Hull]HAI9694242.1 helix-turn-helix domain-containing protein [Escherichia coli]HBR0320564.1 Crp/Fnr family transcriptional regulator [Klebsiella q
MAKAKVLINDTDEAVIKNALDVEDMNEVNINVTRKKKTGFLGTYSIVFHDSVKTLSKMNLKPNAYKIVMYLFGIIEMGNILVNFSQKKIADDLGLQPSNVSRAFKELFDKGVLIKDSEDGHVYLNSNLCTMGVPKNFDQKRMQNLQKSNIETEDFKNQINLFTPTNTTKIKTNDKKVIKKETKENVLEFPMQNDWVDIE